ncbi:proprotein convertase P-domain-containing protein [Limnohabitans sp. T6-20]|uniref:proprotein convertase P-domain-containing protein n=1 Tax=Limnohabitans sp. T6-20 TaxID=1100725 RepID=UPI000D3A0622|nr:hypothetical protein B9Z33_05855 [Limnohabitans sp. T6-20]
MAKIVLEYWPLKPIQAQYLSELCMRSPFWLATLFAATCFLAACGGGGGGTPVSDAPNPASSVSTTCDSRILWAANPATSGTAIPDNNTSGISVTWDNQNCSLTSVSSATLEICLNHQRPADLVWKITPPSGSPLTVTAPTDWNATGTACDSGQGKLQRIDLLPTVQSSVKTLGLWTLNVSDQNAGDVGTLIQWRVVVQGLN